MREGRTPGAIRCSWRRSPGVTGARSGRCTSDTRRGCSSASREGVPTEAVWRKPDAYRGSGAVAAWIWGIGIRRLIDRLRKGSAAARRLPSMSGRTEPSAEEQVLLGVEYGDLGGALNRLSPELRAVIEATALDGLTMREAGRLLGLPTGTVKTRLMRARAELREALA